MDGRVYSPILGRMLSPEPITQAPNYGQNYNRYTYAFNNPLTLKDPSSYGNFNPSARPVGGTADHRNSNAHQPTPRGAEHLGDFGAGDSSGSGGNVSLGLDGIVISFGDSGGGGGGARSDAGFVQGNVAAFSTATNGASVNTIGRSEMGGSPGRELEDSTDSQGQVQPTDPNAHRNPATLAGGAGLMMSTGGGVICVGTVGAEQRSSQPWLFQACFRRTL
ncbi:MAG: hypothetical protein AAGI44_17875 [Pseudomonadota bacterium]